MLKPSCWPNRCIMPVHSTTLANFNPNVELQAHSLLHCSENSFLSFLEQYCSSLSVHRHHCLLACITWEREMELLRISPSPADCLYRTPMELRWSLLLLMRHFAFGKCLVQHQVLERRWLVKLVICHCEVSTSGNRKFMGRSQNGIAATQCSN